MTLAMRTARHGFAPSTRSWSASLFAFSALALLLPLFGIGCRDHAARVAEGRAGAQEVAEASIAPAEAIVATLASPADAAADAGQTPSPAQPAFGSVTASPSSMPPAAAPSAVTPPVRGEWIERLDLPDSGFAYVTPPVGATDRRPIVVAIHGAVDDPGLMCSAWRLIVDVFAFVVCPAGNPIGTADGRKYVWSSGAHIEKRASEAARAVRAKYAQNVHDTTIVYAAFSQGATMAGSFLARNGARFARAVLTEGGYHAFEPPGSAASYRKTGGERVLFTCSQPGCKGSFNGSVNALTRAGIDARALYSGPHGHSIPPPVRESIHDALPWIVEGLTGWEAYAAAPKLPSH